MYVTAVCQDRAMSIEQQPNGINLCSIVYIF